MSRGTSKLVCALLLKYYYGAIGYDVIYVLLWEL